MSEIKQVICIRRDLKMRRGKEIAQGSHGAMAFITRRLQKQYEAENPKIVWVEKVNAFGKTIKVPDAYASAKPIPKLVKDLFKPVELEWINGAFAKVCCQVRSEEELREICQKAKDAGLEVHLIEDRGLTEFHGQLTPTALAIGPDYSEKIDPITGHLDLY